MSRDWFREAIEHAVNEGGPTFTTADFEEALFLLFDWDLSRTQCDGVLRSRSDVHQVGTDDDDDDALWGLAPDTAPDSATPPPLPSRNELAVRFWLQSIGQLGSDPVMAGSTHVAYFARRAVAAADALLAAMSEESPATKPKAD